MSKKVGFLRFKTAMMSKQVNPRMIADYEERRNSLLMDGYRMRHETILPNGVVCRLHHMSNGNDITIRAVDHTLVQKTNHVVTHSQSYETTPEVHQS